ncbi:hypothetical protein B0H16DRAFT_1557628 [Mycena metata]|uniref:Uncharacterized protein n=1 Tax=Mycena metata TaxID=1033252 RepID=A0AAD7ILR7_9AGAR|nr:hypothetical protein B0H16DRAFT_1557628 [Mycena metata]
MGMGMGVDSASGAHHAPPRARCRGGIRVHARCCDRRERGVYEKRERAARAKEREEASAGVGDKHGAAAASSAWPYHPPAHAQGGAERVRGNGGCIRRRAGESQCPAPTLTRTFHLRLHFLQRQQRQCHLVFYHYYPLVRLNIVLLLRQLIIVGKGGPPRYRASLGNYELVLA